MGPRGGMHDCKLGLRLVRVGREPAREQTRACKLTPQKRYAGFLIESQIRRLDTGDAQKISDNACMHVRVLPKVEGSQVKSAAVHGSDQPSQCAPRGQQTCTALGQGMSDRDQISA